MRAHCFHVSAAVTADSDLDCLDASVRALRRRHGQLTTSSTGITPCPAHCGCLTKQNVDDGTHLQTAATPS